MLINMLKQQKHKHWRAMFKYFFNSFIFILKWCLLGNCHQAFKRQIFIHFLELVLYETVGISFFVSVSSLYSFLRLFFLCFFIYFFSVCSSIIMKELVWWTKYTRGIATKMQISLGFCIFFCIPPENLKEIKNEEVFKIIFCMRIFWMFWMRIQLHKKRIFWGNWVKIIYCQSCQ